MRVAEFVISRLSLFIVAFICVPIVSGQTTNITPDTEVGMKPYGAFHGGDIDQVSLSSGKLILNIPLLSYPQRGGKINLGYGLRWQNLTPDVSQVCYQTSDTCSLGGDRSVGAEYPGTLVFLDNLAWSAGGGTSPTLYGNFANAISPDGSLHQMVWTGSTFESIDATGLLYNFNTATLQDSEGVRYVYANTNGGSPIKIEDPNGNFVNATSTGWLDTLGRSINSPSHATSTTNFSGCTGTNAVNSASIWTVPGPNGGTETFKFCFANYSYSFSFLLCGGGYCNNIPIAGSLSMLQSVVLPNNAAWTFQYDPAYAALSQITLPTGGTISYTWGLTVAPCTRSVTTNRSDESTTTQENLVLAVASRTVNANDGTGNHTWTYSSGKITDPLGNDSVHVMTGLAGTGSLYETQAQYYQGSSSTGTLLRTVNTDYTWNANPFLQPGPPFPPTSCTSVVNVVPIRVTMSWPNGQTSKEETDYDSGFMYVPYSYGTPSTVGSYGRVIARRNYDYGSGSPGPLLRQTNTAYMALSGPNASSYLSNNLLSLPYTVQTLDGSGTQKALAQYNYDETSLSASGLTSSNQWDSAPPTSIFRGNNTSVYHWLNSGSLTCQSGSSGGSGSNIISYLTYFDDGNVQTSKDPCGNTTTSAYSLTYWAAFPTTVTNPLGQATNNAFDFNTGLLTSTADHNNLTTSFSYDNMWRLSQVNRPDGAVDTITHQESSFPFTASFNKQINPSQTETTTNVFDGFGRVTQSQLNSDPQGVVYTDTTYDALGRVSTVSNPHRTGTDITTTTGTTTYGYDSLGRKTLETYPDNSVLTTAYCGPSTLVTDPTNRWRRSRADGLDHLVEVDEPNAIGASVASTGCPGSGEPIWVTSYGYDTLGNLSSVLQNGSRSRSFTFDSLSRLLTSSNPEVGTISYTYWPDGPGQTKTDARSITTSYLYDALHRETSRSYSNSDPTVATVYDQSACLGLSACQNIGHSTSMTDAAGSEGWAYQVDASNHRSVQLNERTTSGISKTTTYILDYAGNTTQATYPTGRVVNYTFDSANRPSTVQDGSNGITYASGFQTSPGGTCIVNVTCYTPQGTFYGLSIGQSSSFTGLNLTHTYNNRLQPLEFQASSTGGNAIDITYSFVDPSTSKNAGHVYSITNNLNSSRTENFTYDQLNRIKTAGTSATTGPYCWGYDYSSSYDAWGNLQSQPGGPAYTGCSEYLPAAMTADGNNHLSGFGYDLSGNTTGDGVNSYSWNAESQLKTAAGVTYTYDGDGRRVSKAGSKLYWYGSGGDILAETDASGNTTAEYIFFGGKRIAMLPAGSTPIYYVEDLLGTSRVTTTNAGVVCYDADFYPFGDERPPYTNTCTQNNYRFEGKERDTETGNDDFGARYYSNRFGRWLSADWSSVPVPVPYANLSNPQTLNLYAMVADDPETFADLDGHDVDFWDVVNFVVGAANAWASDNLAGAGRQQQDTTAGKLGAATGDLVATIQGGERAVAGGTGVVAGISLSSTGEGAIVGVPLAVVSAPVAVQGAVSATVGAAHLGAAAADAIKGALQKGGNKDQSSSGNGLPDGATKLKGNQGYRDNDGNIWKKDQLHKDHWDVSDRKGNKIKEVDFNGKQIWPGGPKNKNKQP